MPWNALQIHSRILIAKVVEKVGSDSSIDLDLQKWPSTYICSLILSSYITIAEVLNVKWEEWAWFFQIIIR